MERSFHFDRRPLLEMKPRSTQPADVNARRAASPAAADRTSQPASAESARLASRVRELLSTEKVATVSERRMFGVLAFLYDGNMLCYVSAHGLTVRLARDDKAAAMVGPEGERCVVSGRRMPGFVLVEHAVLKSKPALRSWLAAASDYVATLPRKGTKL